MARPAKGIHCSTTAELARISSTSRSTATPTNTAAIRLECTFQFYPVSAIDEARPDYLLILPWNLKNEIVAQMRTSRAGVAS